MVLTQKLNREKQNSKKVLDQSMAIVLDIEN